MYIQMTVEKSAQGRQTCEGTERLGVVQAGREREGGRTERDRERDRDRQTGAGWGVGGGGGFVQPANDCHEGCPTTA